MGKTARAIILAVLFAGPFLVYLGFGFLWMLERGWIWPTLAALVWTATGVAFAILAARWTRRAGQFLPYFDSDIPETFSPRDRGAWDLVLDEVRDAENVAPERLTNIDLYIDTAKRLSERIARHYHPGVANPIDRVPVLEGLTAIELAAEDLQRLGRQIPGSDLITPAYVKTAMQVSGYIQKASEWYSYVMPLINPASGLPRLMSQRYMTGPAWQDAKQNVTRWFHQAFITRLGVHLIELYSGRLVVGADNYRRMTRRNVLAADAAVPHPPARWAFAGSEAASLEKLVAALPATAPALTDRVAVPPYTAWNAAESSRDRASRRRAVEAATEADVLIHLIDDRTDGRAADLAFLNEWSAWFAGHPEYEKPPLIVVAAGTDQARLTALESTLPESVTRVLPIDLDNPDAARLVSTLAQLRPEIDRVAVIRRLSHESSRSKAGRFAEQIGRRGKELWTKMRTHKTTT